jgi:hypothetical protein
MNILSQIKNNKSSIDIDSIHYCDHITEYPVADIITANWKTVLSPPNINSSKQTYNELIEVYNKSTKRSTQQIETIRAIDANANYFLYELLNKLNITFAKDIFNEMYGVMKPIILNTKNLFNRARPYQLGKFYDMEPDVIVTSTHHTPSYPSGHTFYTRLSCNIVASQYPNLQDELDKITNITAEARIAQGVHYRSDNNASIILADYWYKYLNQQLYGKK